MRSDFIYSAKIQIKFEIKFSTQQIVILQYNKKKNNIFTSIKNILKYIKIK